MRLLSFILCLFLLPCTHTAGASAAATVLAGDTLTTYENQTADFARMWYETAQVDRLAVCRDYFAEPDTVYEYLDGYFDGQLLPRAFDDFFSGVCIKTPIDAPELSG